MTDKITKLISKLPSKERKSLTELLSQIKTGNISNLDFKKLSGFDFLYRVRKGSLRVILKKEVDNFYSLVAVERRGDNTYSNL